MSPQEHLDLLLQRHPELNGLRQPLGEAFTLIRNSLAEGGTLFICGNGGSAADSEHIAGELLKGFLLPRPLTVAEKARLREACPRDDAEYLGDKLQRALRAVALTGHPALASAVMNDTAADLIYAQPLYALGRSGDVLLAISTSGNARNVACAVQTAHAKGILVIGLTGRTGGRLGTMADILLGVPETETAQIQELHLPVYHTLCAMLEAHFFQDAG